MEYNFVCQDLKHIVSYELENVQVTSYAQLTVKSFIYQNRHSILRKFSVKAINNTIEKNKVFPSRLLFATIPRFPVLSTDLAAQKIRMEGLNFVQAELNLIVAERRVLEILTKNVPPAADRKCETGEKVFVYSEMKKSGLVPIKFFIQKGIWWLTITKIST